MKSTKRLVLMLALACFAALPLVGARAQGPACTLADADCKLLAAAEANNGKLTSFQQDFTFTYTLGGVGGAAPTNTTASGTGAFTGGMPANMMSDPTAALGTIKASLDVTGTSNGASGKTQIIITDGTLYINDGTGWKARPMSELLQRAMNSSPATPASDSPALALLGNPALAQGLMALPNVKGIATLAKEAGPDVDGVKTSAFVYNIDVPTLLNAPEFAPILSAAASQMMGGAGGAIPVQTLTSLLKNPKLSLTRYVGDSDQLFHGVAIKFSGTLDLGGATSDISLALDVKLSKIGQPFTITAPAGGATMVAVPAATATK